MTKRKEERRELLKEDEFLSSLEKAAEYIQKNPMQVMAYTVGTLALLAVLFVGLFYKEQSSDKDAQALYKAEKMLQAELEDKDFQFKTEQDKLTAALTELDAVIAAQSGAIRQQAVIHKIKVLIDLGRGSEIRPLYEDLVSDNNGFKFLGLKGLADMNFAEGAYDKALEGYRELAALRGSAPDFSEYSQYKIAMCYKEKGDLTNAKQELSILVDKYEGDDAAAGAPPFLAKAKELLTEIEESDEGDKETT